VVFPLRRLPAVLAPALLLPAAAFAAGPAGSWAQPQLKLVAGAGIFATQAGFDPGGGLTQGALADAVSRLAGTPAPAPGDPTAPASMEQLDRSLVDALGLRDAAARFYLGAVRAGVRPPQRFGSEVVARLLGLRLDHPAGQDALELQPQQQATYAEAAYSFARILQLGAGPAAGPPALRRTDAVAPADLGSSPQVARVEQEALAFSLPPLTEWQRRIVAAAFSYIGYPYVWGGAGPGSAGFDCSGFVWTVYKLTPYPDEGALADAIGGRTTTQMSAEVPRAERIGADELEPGDVMFFGRGPHSKPRQIDHAAIYLGNGWLVQSSTSGVALAPFSGWYQSSFAWARRPLAEAGLS
jgi:cell wall-associated NlpC family hydrolase